MVQYQSPSYIRGCKSPYPPILWAGLIAGTLDAITASVMYWASTGGNPARVFQYVASGVFGKAAFNGGYFMAMWGLIFHYLIAYGFTLLFFFIYPKFRLLSKNKYLTGLAYGVVVWLIMNLMVVPLSNTAPQPIHFPLAFRGMAVIMVMVGLPISVVVHSYYHGK